jgi:hypothetical protein
MKCVTNKLRVHHYPQVPCEPFFVDVEDEKQAHVISNALANQHLFLYDRGYIDDYANAISVVMYENGEWIDYWNEDEMMEFSEFAETYLSK